MTPEQRDILLSMGWALVGMMVGICFAIPAFVMAFFPERAFRTHRKPRWIGFILLALSLWLLIPSSMSYLQLRRALAQAGHPSVSGVQKP